MGKRIKEIVLHVAGERFTIKERREVKKAALEVKDRVGSRPDPYPPKHRHGF